MEMRTWRNVMKKIIAMMAIAVVGTVMTNDVPQRPKLVKRDRFHGNIEKGVPLQIQLEVKRPRLPNVPEDKK